jgi:hypothetical protein
MAARVAENAYQLRKSGLTFAFIEAEKANYPVTILCSTFGVSTSGYYDWRGRQEHPAPRTTANEVLWGDADERGFTGWICRRDRTGTVTRSESAGSALSARRETP